MDGYSVVGSGVEMVGVEVWLGTYVPMANIKLLITASVLSRMSWR